MKQWYGHRIRSRAIIPAILLAPSYANAHCYSRWYYHYPQHCEADVAKLVDARDLKSLGNTPYPIQVQVLSPAPDEDHSWYVEIIKLPEDISRDEAIEKLKALMK